MVVLYSDLLYNESVGVEAVDGGVRKQAKIAAW